MATGGAPKFWVALPGHGKAQELSRAELEQKRARGELPAGTLVAKFGSSDWKPLDALDELIATLPPEDKENSKFEEIEAAPPSAAQGVDAFEAPPEVAPTIAGSVSGIEAPPEVAPTAIAPVPEGLPQIPEPEAPRRSRTVVIVLASALVAILLSSTVLYAWMRYGYARGSVLEHVPADCRRLEYVDFDGIDASSPMKGLLGKRDKTFTDWLEDLDDEDGFRRSKDDDEAKGRASAVRAMKKLGLKPYGDVKEVAYCEVKDGDEVDKLVVIGGTLHGKDALGAIREALVRRDRKVKDDTLVIDDLDGHPLLKLDENRSIVMATSQVAIIAKRKVAARYLQSKPTVRTYGLRDGDLIVRRWSSTGDKDPEGDERYTIKGDKLLVVRTWTVTPKTDPTTLKGDFTAAANRIRRLDGLDVLADAYDAVDPKVAGEEARYEISWPLKDVAKAEKVMVDADRREMRAIVEAMRFAPAVEYFHHTVMPGVDYFDLRLSPW